jgi:conjugative transfer signal peptidase TraF
MPRGFYILSQSKIVHRGDYVVVCLPKTLSNFALQRGYLMRGYCPSGSQPLLKKVVAEGGDIVALTSSDVRVYHNQLLNSVTLKTDLHNRSIPAVLRGTYMLKQNTLWLYGLKSPRSWDSRYFGPIESSGVC